MLFLLVLVLLVLFVLLSFLVLVVLVVVLLVGVGVVLVVNALWPRSDGRWRCQLSPLGCLLKTWLGISRRAIIAPTALSAHKLYPCQKFF